MHARFPDRNQFQLWLGESKLYDKPENAIADAISSIKGHVAQGFLQNQKLILGPQIPKSTPRYQDILKLFKSQTSIDDFMKAAVFVVGIACNSKAAQAAEEANDPYIQAAILELKQLTAELVKSGLPAKLSLLLLYVPLAQKQQLVEEFDKKLKGLQ